MAYDGRTDFYNPTITASMAKFVTEQEMMARIQRYRTFWRYYVGQHHAHQREDDPEDDLVTFNYCRAMVDKSISFLVGKDFTFKTKNENEHYLTQIQAPIDNVWTLNEKQLLAWSIVQIGSVCGDCFVKVSWDSKLELKEGESPLKQLRIIAYDPAMIVPEYSERDRNRMVSCQVSWIGFSEETDLKNQAHVFKEIWYEDRVEFWKDEEYHGQADNPLGEIPIVHIKNKPMENALFGESDLSPIIPLNKNLNEKATDVSDIINYHAAPVTLLFGIRPSNLEKGANKVWGNIPKDGDVRNLQMHSDLPASNRFMELTKQVMHEVASIPQNTLGTQQIPANTSGVALHIQYQPLVELTDRKRISYGAGFAKINRLILRNLEIADVIDLDITVPVMDEDGEIARDAKGREIWRPAIDPLYRYATETVWGDPLPRDELIQMQLIQQQLQAGLLSKQTAMRQLGVSDPMKEMALIEQEQFRAAEVQNTIMLSQIYTQQGQEVDLTPMEPAANITEAGQQQGNIGQVLQEDMTPEGAAKQTLRNSL